MIIDISKWIVIIVIFFIAFACSLYLIFSFFAVAVKQQDALKLLKNGPDVTNNTMIKVRNMECPNMFYEWTQLNESDLAENTIATVYEHVQCDKADDFKKMKSVGTRPAIHYFGESFGATVLTTFFTLFGVIAEDGIPVRMTNFLIFIFYFLLGSRI